MRTLERYVFGSFLSSFVLAFLVLTFVMTIGLMVQIVGYILDGIPMSLVGEFAMVSFPETLQWTMPLALLVSSVLVFSRMSADSEIAAMRACGVNLLGIMKWPMIFALVCTLVGFYINNEIVPRGHHVRRSLKTKVSVDTGLDLLEPGKAITDLPDVKITFASRDGNWLHDLVVMDYSDDKVDRQITASKALVTSEGRDIVLDLYQLTADPIDADHDTMGVANRVQYRVKDALKDKRYTRRDKDLRTFEVLEKLRELDRKLETAEGSSRDKESRRHMLKCERSNLRTEFMKRLVFAMASFCFVLIGIPLGIKAQRKESSIGMAISLVVSLGYYMIVMLTLGLEDQPQFYPEYLIWLSVVACFAFAARLIPKNL